MAEAVPKIGVFKLRGRPASRGELIHTPDLIKNSQRQLWQAD